MALLFPSPLSLSIKPRNWALFFSIIPLLSQLKFKLDVWTTSCHVSTLVRVRFWPEAIYFIFVQVQIISHELDSSDFPTSKIFVNNIVPGNHWKLVFPKNVKIRLSRNSMKFIWITRFCKKNPTMSFVLSSEI